MVASRLDLTGGRVLDLYAGSGALGIEALSRGAAECTFVERDRTVVRVLRENLRACGFEDRSTVVSLPIAAALPRLRPGFDLVLIDPPYAERGAAALVGQVERFNLVAAGGMVIVEHSAGESVAACGELQLTHTRAYGKTCLSLLTTCRSEDDTAP